MKTRQSQWIQAAASGKVFFIKYEDQLPRTVASGARLQLDQVESLFLTDAGVQEGRTKALEGGVTQKNALKEALFTDHLAPLVAAAQLAGLTGPVPDLQKVVLPKSTTSVPRLTAAARGMIGSVTPFAKQLIVVGMPVDFIDQLNAAIVALESAVTTNRDHKGSRVGATKALESHEQIAGKVFRFLDRMVRSELRKGSPALAEWDSIRNLTRRGASATPAASTPTPAPAPAPTPAAAPAAATAETKEVPPTTA